MRENLKSYFNNRHIFSAVDFITSWWWWCYNEMTSVENKWFDCSPECAKLVVICPIVPRLCLHAASNCAGQWMWWLGATILPSWIVQLSAF